MDTPQIFQDRRQAGHLLAQRLTGYAGRADVVVLALPRGGVPVGFCVAQALGAPLDVLIVRKLGVPGHEEYAMGAIAAGGLCVLQHEVLQQLRIDSETVEAAQRRALQEIERRRQLYRPGPPLPLRGRCVIVVDDGLATGATMQAAVQVLRQAQPARIVAAVPVAATEACEALATQVDELVCLATPEPFQAVSLWYRHFDQTSDDEVVRLLQQAASASGRPAPPPDERPG
ncbi:MAG: phosphoribosyltransferase [Burkholderiaceae bacterium]